MIKKLEKLEKAKQYLTFLGLDKSKRLKRDVSRIFWQIGTYIEFTKAPPLLVSRGVHFQNCDSKCSKNVLWPCWFFDFFVKHFSNYLSLHYEILFLVDDF